MIKATTWFSSSTHNHFYTQILCALFFFHLPSHDFTIQNPPQSSSLVQGSSHLRCDSSCHRLFQVHLGPPSGLFAPRTGPEPCSFELEPWLAADSELRVTRVTGGRGSRAPGGCPSSCHWPWLFWRTCNLPVTAALRLGLSPALVPLHDAAEPELYSGSSNLSENLPQTRNSCHWGSCQHPLALLFALHFKRLLESGSSPRAGLCARASSWRHRTRTLLFRTWARTHWTRDSSSSPWQRQTLTLQTWRPVSHWVCGFWLRLTLRRWTCPPPNMKKCIMAVWGRSGAVGNNTANVTTSPGSDPGDPEAALASGSRPRPTRAMVPVENMYYSRGPLDEQKIPRGGARVVQSGMQFPNSYRCNKVLVYQKKYHGCARTMINFQNHCRWIKKKILNLNRSMQRVLQGFWVHHPAVCLYCLLDTNHFDHKVKVFLFNIWDIGWLSVWLLFSNQQLNMDTALPIDWCSEVTSDFVIDQQLR